MKKIDIQLNKEPILLDKAIRRIYFGGERLREIQIYQDSLGKAHTIRVIYSKPKNEKRYS